MKISIIIVTYNSQSLISDCLQSILDYADISLDEIEIIVVDNSSGENAEELKSRVENHSVAKKIKTKYIHNVANLGYGQGNNIGIFNSTGDIVCIMNPDVRFTEPLFKDVLLKFEDSNLALLGYKQTGGFDYSFYMKPELKSAFSGWKMKLLNKRDSFNPKKHYLSGAFFFIDKNKFSQIGMFDEKIFMYFEEPHPKFSPPTTKSPGFTFFEKSGSRDSNA
jgi:GT2 family glycosyltransferase